MFKENKGDVLHGILLIVLFSFSAFYIADFDFVKRLSFSPLIVGIILGMLYANSLRNKLPETWVPGIKFCSKTILRTGVVLYGFRLTFQQVAAVGLPAIAADTVIVVGTLLLGLLLGKLLRVDGDTALMTSTGSAICGAAAVLGAEPVVRCEAHKTAVAVSTVVIFGTLSMFLYPVMYRAGMLDGLTEQGVAIYTGATLHEVAHVVGAGNAIDAAGGNIADAATITKMIRVMMLAPVLVIMSLCLSRRNAGGRSGGEAQNHHTLVCVLLPRCHRHQFAVGEHVAHSGLHAGNRSRLHQQPGHLPADDGHDGPGRGNQYRQIQTGGCETFPLGRRLVCVAGRRRILYREISVLMEDVPVC